MRYLVTLYFILSYFCISAQSGRPANYVKENYTKTVYYIPMRDGIKLYTAVYTPKDLSTTYPILMKRTCYSVAPYGEDKFPRSLGPSKYLMESKYIFVYQDVRGRWMSEGQFDNMRPHVPGNDPDLKGNIDESSDTWDTIDWLLKNIKNHNGRVGQWGISYPGFYTAAALPEAHPALKASSPQAPIADFFFDDFHHMGAFLQSYLFAFPVFGVQKENPTTQSWYGNAWNDLRARKNTGDAYQYNLELGPLKNVTENYYSDNFFWKQVVDHPNYDEFWQKRSILPHLNGVDHAVLTVGGWFDAEDLYGPLNIYKTLEKNNPGIQNSIIMGPWSHGDWARETGSQSVNHIFFGDSISTYYQLNIEKPFFEYHLKGVGDLKLPEAKMFDTGLNTWESFDQWPPQQTERVILRFEKNGKLVINNTVDEEVYFSYISDPEKPVPYRSEISSVPFTPRAFMTDDQRHASTRPDVLTFQTDILKNDFRLAGEIMANLKVILSITDADFIVKLIDVFPENTKATKATPDHVKMGGYQQLVRSEVFRGRFRNSFSNPEPFKPGQEEEVAFPLQDVLHTFKKGHRIMIQIHSTWFPYIDRNPQKYVDNIYKADAADFTKGVIQVLSSSEIVIGENQGIEDILKD